MVSQRAWRLSRRIAASAETIDEHTDAGAAPRGAHQCQEAALPDRRHAGLLRRRRSRAHPGCPEEAAACARRLQRRTRRRSSGCSNAGTHWAPPAGPPAPCLPSGGWPSRAVSAASSLRGHVAEGLAAIPRSPTRDWPAGARSSEPMPRSVHDERGRGLQHEGRRRKDHDGGEPVVSRRGGRPADTALGSRPAGGVQLRLPRAAARRRFRQEEPGERPGARRSHQGDRLRQPGPAAGGLRLPQARSVARSTRQAGTRGDRSPRHARP